MTALADGGGVDRHRGVGSTGATLNERGGRAFATRMRGWIVVLFLIAGCDDAEVPIEKLETPRIEIDARPPPPPPPPRRVHGEAPPELAALRGDDWVVTITDRGDGRRRRLDAVLARQLIDRLRADTSWSPGVYGCVCGDGHELALTRGGESLTMVYSCGNVWMENGDEHGLARDAKVWFDAICGGC